MTEQYVGTNLVEVETPDLPDRKYNVIYADFPLTYRDKASAGERGSSFKYTTMTSQQILSFPMQSIAKEDCALFLWMTWPQIEFGLEMIRSFGFTYKTNAFVWIKRNKHFHHNFRGFILSVIRGDMSEEELIKRITSKFFWGMGNYTRSNSEFVLLATKGSPKRISGGVHQIVDYPVGQHSAKPPIVRDRIVELMGDVPRIELFARDAAEGWDVWGLEAPKSS